MKRKLGKTMALVVAAGGLSTAASAQVLYDNGPIVTTPTGACIPVGASASEVQAGNINAGYNYNGAFPFRVADDFAVPAAGWQVTGFTFYGYQTGAGAGASTFTGHTVQIWNGPPGGGGAVIAGDTITNVQTSSVFSNTYRYFNATCATDRAIFVNTITIPAVNLASGVYWVDYAATGTSASGPWAVPVTITGQVSPPGANALQSNAGVWGPLLDGANPQECAFQVLGNGTPAPTGACCLGAPSYSCLVTSQTSCGALGGTYAGDNITCAAANCPPPPTGRCCFFAGTCQVLTQANCVAQQGSYGGDGTDCSTPGICPAGWVETGDAGDLPATAQVIAGSGGLTGIQGALTTNDVDMYLFNICDEANFNATAVGGTTFDTQMWLFNTSGTGVAFNDDSVGLQSTVTSQFVNANGDYLIAISGYDNDALDSSLNEIWLDTPFNIERAPDGAGAANPVNSWSGVGASGSYTIVMQGSCYASTANFGACCLGAPSYACVQTTAAGCSAQGGTFTSIGTSCATANCPPAPTGACCFLNGSCQSLSQSNCTSQGGTYAGDNVTCAAANCPQPPAGTHVEFPDAGELPGTAQPAAGSGSLTSIVGSLGTGDADMFRIDICDAANFSASTVGGTTVDTQLFLFKLDGTGVAHNDDDPAATGLQSVLSATFVAPLGNANYYLAVSQYNKDPNGTPSGGLIWINTPFNVERAPDGPAAAEPIGSWTVTTGLGGSYTIALTGSCFVGAACYANCDGSSGNPLLTANDFSCFLNKYVGGDSYADCDGVGGLTANDFTCFLGKYTAGCS